MCKLAFACYYVPMAIAFARISYHSRSQGHSAVAGAAYRAGEKLYDERTGEVHNFENREDVKYSTILLPEGADERFLDRETLWNVVEATEKRKNSQVAKDVILALPRELDLSQQIDVAHHFAQHHFVKHGLAVDLAIHDHGDGNPHAHLYVTTRRLRGDRFDKYKARDLEPDVARGRVVAPEYWGEQWRDCQNAYFKAQGLELMVDANYLIAMRHEGRIRGEKAHYLKEENQLRRAASMEIAQHDPESVLNLLGTQNAVFSERDMALLLNKHTDSPETFQASLIQLKAHPELIALGPGDDGRERYTTQANYEREVRLSEHVTALDFRQSHPVEGAIVTQAARDAGLNDEQTQALHALAKSSALSAVVGRAGTGKSYMMKAARQMWEASGYRVLGVAVSGIAARGLAAETGMQASTIYAFRAGLASGRITLSPNDVIVMDEAGMTDLTDMAAIVEMAHKAGAKFTPIGDPAQLQAIGAGAPFRAIVEQVGFSELSQIQRQKDSSDCVASSLLAQGDILKALTHYDAKGQVHLVESPDEEEGDGGDSGGGVTHSRLVAHWARGINADNLDKHLILAHRNDDVAALNLAARQAMYEKGLLGDIHRVKGHRGMMSLAVGERILFLQNDKHLGVSNGEFATIKAIESGRVRAQISSGASRTLEFSPDEYAHFDYGYAATVHKSQGTTVDHTFVYVAGQGWDRFLTYVAMTRHRLSLNVYAASSHFHDIAALGKRLSRAVLKDSVLDWPVSFAIRRGFDPEHILGRCIGTLAGIKQRIYDKWLFIRNYEAYQIRKAHQARLASRTTRREMARKVAMFVDLRNGLATQAQQMRQDLAPQEKFYQHHDYPAWYEQTLLRNRLAFEIQQDYALFEQALQLNRVSDDKLVHYANLHQRHCDIEQYLDAVVAGKPVHRYREAQRIYPEIKAYLSSLAYQGAQRGMETNALTQQLRDDAKAYRRIHYLAQLTPTERQAFRTVDAYVRAKEAVNTSIKEAYALGGFEHLSEQAVAQLTQQKTRCDALAHQIESAPLRYAPGVQFHDLTHERLTAESERHQCRETVKQLDNAALPLAQRDALCYTLLSDERHYPFIAEQGIDWADLRARSKVHETREKLRTLPADARRAYRKVTDYQQARMNAGIAWSRLFEEKAQGNPIPQAQWQFALALSHARDKLAYELVEHSECCRPFILESTLALADIEKHALRYHDAVNIRQQKQSSESKSSHQQRMLPQSRIFTDKQTTAFRFEQKVVNDALVSLGETFYQQVLGEPTQRTPHQLRYGQKGSLSVTLQGKRAGNWYSFETDEGGGPLQLLMSSTHGRGLSFKDALKEGASLAGLSPTPSSFIAKSNRPTPSPEKDTQALTDKTEKIARARYYFESAQSIEGTLGERYLREHRQLVGDLSAFRFHPRIRDIKFDVHGKQQASYHPGIIVGAKNVRGEITAVQTILLDATTANKVDKNMVGAVKRTRGDLKGSAVPIHTGNSNKIIIAEGPETAASLIQVEPDANIYVTLGSIKNAASLDWLAKKHQTDTFYFAADNDGPQAKSMKALRAVATTLHEHHDIKARVATPSLPNQEKCDFNDVLKAQGITGVKAQWEQHKPMLLDKAPRQSLLPKEDIHQRLYHQVDEWERLRHLNHSTINTLLEEKTRLDKETRPNAREALERHYRESMESLCQNKRLLSKVKAVAPGLAKEFQTMVKPEKAVTIDWLSDEYKAEFEALRTSKNPEHEYLVKFYDILKNPKHKQHIKAATRQLESLSLDIAGSQIKMEKLKGFAPKLMAKVKGFGQYRARQRDKGRSL